MDSIIFTRIKGLCEKKGITINKLESEIGMGQYSITRWKTSSSPTVDKLLRVAQYFGVSLDYLTGLSSIKQTAESITNDERLQSIIHIWIQLSEHNKNVVEAMMMLHADHDPFDTKFIDRLSYLAMANEEKIEKEIPKNGKLQAND